MALMSSILKIIILSLLVLSATAQEDPSEQLDLRKFFVTSFAENGSDFYVRPSSVTDDSLYAAFVQQMFHVLEYYLEHYSAIDKELENLYQLLPDTVKVQKAVEQLLLTDTYLNTLVSNTLYQKDVSKIHIDSLMGIVSRFYYLHRLPSGKIVMHICIGVNEVMDLPQNEHSPYLNAFSWMLVRTQNIWGLIQEDIVSVNQIDADISDEALNHLKLENYRKIQANQHVREMLIAFYHKNAAFLNFRLYD